MRMRPRQCIRTTFLSLISAGNLIDRAIAQRCGIMWGIIRWVTLNDQKNTMALSNAHTPTHNTALMNFILLTQHCDTRWVYTRIMHAYYSSHPSCVNYYSRAQRIVALFCRNFHARNSSQDKCKCKLTFDCVHVREVQLPTSCKYNYYLVPRGLHGGENSIRIYLCNS